MSVSDKAANVMLKQLLAFCISMFCWVSVRGQALVRVLGVPVARSKLANLGMRW
jgi:hypothetical protein